MLMAVQTTKQGNVDYSESWKIVWNGNNGFGGKSVSECPEKERCWWFFLGGMVTMLSFVLFNAVTSVVICQAMS